MIHFQYPELFLLTIPAWFAYRRWGQVAGWTGWIRLGLIGLLLLAMTGPRVNLVGRGLDIVVVADRSRSMPSDSQQRIRELIQNLEASRAAGDALGIVTFGSRAEVEQTLLSESQLAEYTKQILPDGSDLNDAVTTSLKLVNPKRPARILVLSDGEANGPDPRSAARRAREAQVPIDFRLFERPTVGDVAIESVQLPESVAPREPFQFSVWVYANKETHGSIAVLREGKPIASAERDFHTGMNQLLFRDLLEVGGFYHYDLRLVVERDPLRENNRAAGVVRVEAGPRLLVLNSDGTASRLVRQLEAGRIPVDVAVAAQQPLSQDDLDRYRAVIIENVPAGDLGRVRMEQLAQFVEDLGGGLMLTGGERSFGVGGYFRSALDDTLPVSMELREEHRKMRIALAIALDRSGSMTAMVAGGKSKMDLANLGTAECVRMLGPSDKVAVIAVDSSPHVIQPLTNVDDGEAIAQQALGIESMGGGIFIYEALVAAGEELMKAGDYSTRHIVLFADAADSEEPGNYETLLKKYIDSGVTVSVIGLGTEMDSDAELLKDIAKRGNGNVMFTADAQELPRLFTQDTMSVARSTFVKKDAETQPAGIPGRSLPDARLMGNFPAGTFPNVDGYNLSYLKPGATMAVVTEDEYQAPLSAFWYRGLGRVAALTLEVDGPNSGQFVRWNESSDFLITHARWLLGGANPQDVYITLQRDGQDAVATVELDPDRTNRQAAETLQLIVVPPAQGRAEPIRPDFLWTGPDSLEARFRMDRIGTYRTLVKSSGRQFTRGPAVTLPYSPEFVPRIGLPEGKQILRDMADLSGGIERTDVTEIFHDPPRAAQTVSLLPILFAMAIGLLLLEIAGRRLSLWERMADVVEADRVPSAQLQKPKLWRRWVSLPRRRKPPAVPSTDADHPVPERPGAGKPSPKSQPSVSDVFAQAKNRAKRRLK